ncbi:MAG: AtpZ/AtpI family protein [Spirochaetia bacterium]|nr:AtpZ/AtpI family protein [Spirochaetia bacterium]
MLSDDEKNEIHKKIGELKKNQSEFRKTRPVKNDDAGDDDIGKFRLLGIAYEFMSLILLSSIGGYFIGKYTDTQPWTMIASIFTGFGYAFYRLYQSVNK